MPNRILRDGIVRSQRVATLSFAGEVFYRRLMSVVDDYGRCEAHPTLLKAALYPWQLDQVSEHDVRTWLAECAHNDRRLVVVYEVEGKKYLQIEGFGQRLRTSSKYPPPLESDNDSTMRAQCAHDASTMSAQCPHDDGHSAARARGRTNAEAETESYAESETDAEAYKKTHTSGSLESSPEKFALELDDPEPEKPPGKLRVISPDAALFRALGWHGGWRFVQKPECNAEVVRSIYELSERQLTPDESLDSPYMVWARLQWFEEFWMEYRDIRDVDKRAARIAYFRRVKTLALHDRVIQAIEEQKQYYLEREESKRPHAATWINNERWENHHVAAEA